MTSPIFTAAKAYASADNKAGITRSILVDLLVAEGVIVGFNKQQTLDDGKKGYTPDAIACRDGIVAAWGKKAITLWNSDTKTLSEENKAAKRHMIMQVGTRMNKINKALDERLNPVEQGPTPRKADDKFLREWLALGAKRVESSDGAGDLDLVEITEWIAKSPIK
jgi:hypothetical protein